MQKHPVVFGRTLLMVSLVSTALSLVSSIAVAEPRIKDPIRAEFPQREQQREWFVQAEYAAKRGRLAEYQQLLDQLGDYPLVPYLELTRLQQVGYLANEDRVLAFLEAYRDSPMDWQLRQPWLDYLARKGEKQRFVRDFKAPGSTENQCRYLRYQHDLKLIPTDALYRAVDQLWLTGSSLPKACDSLLKQWADAGQRSTDKVWARLQLAAEDGKHTLVPYLGGLLPKDMGYLAEHYHRVRRDPSQVTRFDYLAGKHPGHEAQIVTYGFSRLIWRDPDRALRFIEQLPKHVTLSEEQWSFLEQRFAVALSSKDHKYAGAWLARLDASEHTDQTLQWQLGDWVREGQWQALLDFTQSAVVTAEQPEWQYWAARAAAELGQEEQAKARYQKLAAQRNYYGFMAAARLQTPFSLAAEPVDLSADEIASVRNLPAVQRAYEFLQMQRYIDARREWFSLLGHLSGREQIAMAVLADQWGWHDQVIYTLGQLGEFDAVELRFPEAYLDIHQNYADRVGIDINWALAISRRESAFRHDAASGAGAHGLMQILPSTARYLERKSLSVSELHHAPTNVRLGTQYLAELKGRLGNNWMLGTAAYNAGIYRVFEWLPDDPIDADRWIETIPFKETRDYVKNVLVYQQIYRTLRQDNDEAIFPQVAAMQISKAGAGRD
ncbi:murein transglycosylase [Pseudidiomarina aestuarii]|uniref:Murein transglycosylase n=1 Tax=Pseudidiomarina aestuarii TaxID=624146 RepID=A0A7Z6ZVD2_9GAMM|nr:transglycosylase SLT domain-containing protein [Pseudidiomarina aestuarii]RUO42103.1 murein transglycosylase [Pseudidiomarina aestuarii]